MTGMVMVTKSISGICRGDSTTIRTSNPKPHHDNEEEEEEEDEEKQQQQQQNQVSLMELLIAVLRKSMVSCRVLEHQQQHGGDDGDDVSSVEIGWPTNVKHITHVTFDRFHGFLGLPVEFQVEVPIKAPSASANVFGVSAESMQCCYDSRGNSVPTILLLMQERLYSQGGLKAEGIFRINPENSKEEHVRDQLNSGIVPDDIDVHCLAGLIKAWFRELPCGVLDGLSPEQVLQCNTEEESAEVVKLLKPTEAALLNWAIDLMADVVEEEGVNKMNARNIAMVFAPNMTQMSDPLTALMHAVQVMNLLKTLITKNIREREETGTEGSSPLSSRSSSQQTDGDYDSQEEMNTSCELRRTPASDYDDSSHRARYSHGSESDEEDRVDSLRDVEESFLRKLDETTETGSPDDMQIRCEIPKSPKSYCSSAYDESSISFSDSKVGSSSTSTRETEDSSGSSYTTTSYPTDPTCPSEVSKAATTDDKEMVDDQMPGARLSLPCSLKGV